MPANLTDDFRGGYFSDIQHTAYELEGSRGEPSVVVPAFDGADGMRPFPEGTEGTDKDAEARLDSGADMTLVNGDGKNRSYESVGKVRKCFFLNHKLLLEKYGLRNRRTLRKKMMQLAIHEVTHWVQEYHNEYYTTQREQIEEATWSSPGIYDKIANLKIK